MSIDNPSFLSRHQFLFYRLFSLFGLIPVGAYLCIHLLTNLTVVDSPATFQRQVDTIHSLGGALPFVEWVFIFIPLIFHGVMGLMIVTTGSFNTGAYPYVRNFRYTLQRATGMIAFAFIMYHVIQLHHLGHALGGGQFDPEHATTSTASALSPLAVKIIYAIGMLSCVYHLANGVWTAGITWGVWSSKAGQRRSSYCCLAFGLALAAVGLGALLGFSFVNVEQAKQIEARHEQNERLLNETVPKGAASNEASTEVETSPSSR